MRILLATMMIAANMLTACSDQAEKIDHEDPAAVTKAMVSAFRDHDLKTLASTFHPDHPEEFRQSTLAFAQNQDAIEQWVFYDDQSEIKKFAGNWEGYLRGPKYDLYWEGPELADGLREMRLFAITKPDRYDAIFVVVLNRHEDGWFVQEITVLDDDDFGSLPGSQAELRAYEAEIRAYEDF